MSYLYPIYSIHSIHTFQLHIFIHFLYLWSICTPPYILVSAIAHCIYYAKGGRNRGSTSIHVKRKILDLNIVFQLRIWNPIKRNGVDQLRIWNCDQLAVADGVELNLWDKVGPNYKFDQHLREHKNIFLGGGVGGVNHPFWPHNVQNLSWKNTKRKKVASFLVSMLLSVWFVLPN